MNQGIYFGQVVIGPAGSGKVYNMLFSRLIAKLCRTWLRHSAEMLSYSISIQLLNTIHIGAMLVIQILSRH